MCVSVAARARNRTQFEALVARSWANREASFVRPFRSQDSIPATR